MSNNPQDTAAEVANIAGTLEVVDEMLRATDGPEDAANHDEILRDADDLVMIAKVDGVLDCVADKLEADGYDEAAQFVREHKKGGALQNGIDGGEQPTISQEDQDFLDFLEAVSRSAA